MYILSSRVRNASAHRLGPGRARTGWPLGPVLSVRGAYPVAMVLERLPVVTRLPGKIQSGESDCFSHPE